jgi:hypothetical protein
MALVIPSVPGRRFLLDLILEDIMSARSIPMRHGICDLTIQAIVTRRFHAAHIRIFTKRYDARPIMALIDSPWEYPAIPGWTGLDVKDGRRRRVCE